MATLERPQAQRTHTQDSVASTDFDPDAVPSPFPSGGRAFATSEPEPARGRSAAPTASHRPPLDASDSRDPASQSPGGSTRSISRAVVDRVKRAMSASRDRQSDYSVERGRRLSDSRGQPVAEDQPRGRSPLSAFRPRSMSRGPSGSQQMVPTLSEFEMQDDRTLTSGTYPLSKSVTRSSSRGRAPAGGKVFSTGRGGAGNLIGVQAGEDLSEFDGEEDPQVLQAAREDRSRSREREGYVEMAASGRGGRGNIRSQSRGRDLELGRVPTVHEEQERIEAEDEELRMLEIMRKRERDGPEHWVSTGRGGAGNFFSSWRRSPSSKPDKAA